MGTASNQEPTIIYAGTTVSWRKSLPNYPASAGWSLKYHIRVEGEGSAITITATADGDEHVIAISASTTGKWKAGKYNWQSYAQKEDERYFIASGGFEVKADIATLADNYDTRSIVKRTLDAIDSLILNKPNSDVSTITIANQSITKMSIRELLEWRDYYKREYAIEVERERLLQGKAKMNRIRVRL